MRNYAKKTAIIAAASMALSSFSLVGPVMAADRSNDVVAPNVSPDNDVSGRNTASRTAVNHADNAMDINGVRMLLSHATDAATRENGFGDFAGFFDNAQAPANRDERAADASKADQNDAKVADQKELDQKIAQFRSDWKAKYNQDFHVGNESVVYADITPFVLTPEARTAAGEVRTDDQKSAPAEARDRGTNTAPPQATEHRDAVDHASQTQRPGRSLTNQASELAARGDRYELNVPEYKSAPAVTVPIVRESQNDYRFARGASFDRSQLRQNLSSHIQAIEDHKDRWPTDVNEAYRIVTQHILMAVADTDGSAARPASAELRGARDNAADRPASNAGTIDSSTNADRNSPTGINK